METTEKKIPSSPFRSTNKCECYLCDRRTLTEPLTFEEQKKLLQMADNLSHFLAELHKAGERYFKELKESNHKISKEDELVHWDCFDHAGSFGCDYEKWTEEKIGPRPQEVRKREKVEQEKEATAEVIEKFMNE